MIIVAVIIVIVIAALAVAIIIVAVAGSAHAGSPPLVERGALGRRTSSDGALAIVVVSDGWPNA